MNGKLEKAVELALIECQKVINDLNKDFNGQPPKSLIVKYHDKYNVDMITFGNIISAWKVTVDNISKINNLLLKPAFIPVNGMYYNEGTAYFAINMEENKIVLDWQVGPRFGRGFIYDIEELNNEVKLSIDKLIWLS